MRILVLPALMGLALVPACTSRSPSSPDAGPNEVQFDAGFMWGTSTAAFQVERGDAHVDWSHWVTLHPDAAGDQPDKGGDDALAHAADDAALMASEGHNAYRFSIEWGRLFPTLASMTSMTPDPAAVAAYDAELAALRASHITPLVTLQHFALPDWLDDVTQSSQPQGWERPEAPALFAQFCGWAGARWGGDVDWWVTLNEPVNMAIGGYLQGSFPPGVVFDLARTFTVVRSELRAHAACFDALKAADAVDADGDGHASMVSIAAHLRTYHPYDPTDPADAAAAQRARYVANDWILDGIVKGDLDYDFDGTLTGPDDVTADPSLVGRADYLGVNYYSDTLISASTGLVLPAPLNFAVFQSSLPTTRPKTDFQWDIYPEGFGTVLDEAAGYGLPIVVTENGIADRADVMRGRFLAEHLWQMGLAIARGDRVLGYFHWSLLDNFEWASGFCPEFGLHSVDATTGARTARPSAGLYSQILRAGKLTRELVSAQPPYGAPTYCE